MNFYSMLYKKACLLITIIFALPLTKNFTNHSINIEGNIELVDINEAIKLKITYNEPKIIYGYSFLKIYQDNTLLYNESLYVPDINNKEYTLNSISTYNTLSTIKIETNFYNNKGYDDTVVTIKYYSPSNKTRMANFNVKYNSKNPINYKFSGSGNNVTITKEYETFKLTGKNVLETIGRYVDFSSYSLNINPIFPLYFNSNAIVLLDIEFDNLDFDDDKTVIYLNSINENGTYYLNNSFDFYISKETSDISIYYDESYYDTLLPFFIPLNKGYDFYISGIIKFEEVNKNKETYYSNFKIKVGSKQIDETFRNDDYRKFSYVEEEILEGIKYES